MLRNIAKKVGPNSAQLRKSCRSPTKCRFGTTRKSARPTTTPSLTTLNKNTESATSSRLDSILRPKVTRLRAFRSTKAALATGVVVPTAAALATTTATTTTTTTSLQQPQPLNSHQSSHHSPHLKRLYSFMQSDPFLGPIDGVLSGISPSFPVSSKTIGVIDTPDDFYTTLLSSIRSAKSRICLSALYLGSGEMELQLVSAVEEALQKSPDLHVLTLFDKHRGQRLDKQGNSSFNLFSRLSEKYPGRVCSALYVPPCLMSDNAGDALNSIKNAGLIADETSVQEGLLTKIGSQIRHLLREKASGRAKELFSVHHMKAYIVDDVSIISGANLSDIYFTNRQDRYVSIKNRELSDYVTGVVQALSFGGQKNTQFSFFGKDIEGKVTEMAPTFVDTDDNDWFSIPSIKTLNINNEKEQIETIYKLLQPNVSEIFNERRSKRNQKNRTANTDSSNDDTDLDMIIYPSLQISSFGIRHDEKAMIGTLDALKVASMPSGSLEPRAGDAQSNESATKIGDSAGKVDGGHSPYKNQRSTKHFDADRTQFFGLNLFMLTGYFNVSKVFLDAIGNIARLYKDYAHYDLIRNPANKQKMLAMRHLQLKQRLDAENNTENNNGEISSLSQPDRPFKRLPSYPLPALDGILVAASRQGNGWWQAGGLPGHVPDIYKSIIDGFNDKARRSWNHSEPDLAMGDSKPTSIVRVHALEYERPGWSYHAKGLFVQPGLYTNWASQFRPRDVNNNDDNNDGKDQKAESEVSQTDSVGGDDSTTDFISTQEKLTHQILLNETDRSRPRQLVSATKPLWTTVGSSNYGRRSLNLDSELQLSMLIPSQVHRDLILKPTNHQPADPQTQEQEDILERMNQDVGNSVYYSVKEDQIFVHPVAYALRPIVKFFL